MEYVLVYLMHLSIIILVACKYHAVFVPPSLDTRYLHVMGAGSNLDAPQGYEEFKKVNEIFIHEEYEPTAKLNDLAILRVSRRGGLITVLVLTEVAQSFFWFISSLSPASLFLFIFKVY